MSFERFAVIALSFLAMSPAPAQEEPAQVEQMPGGHMGQDMMQMMMHCARHAPEMMKEANGHDHDKGAGEMDDHARGMQMPGVMQGHTESDGNLRFRAVEAIAKAFLAGQTEGVDEGVEVVEISLQDGSYLVEYRFQNRTRVLQVDARTGEVTRAGNE